MPGIKHCHFTDVDLKDVVMEGAEKVKMRMVIGKKDGAPNFYMRVFEVAPGGCTPLHTHFFEHENYVIEGNGVLVKADGTTEPLVPGDIAFVPPNIKHQYRNPGDTTFKFICLVPRDD